MSADRRARACPVCSSEALSPETDYVSYQSHARFEALGETNWFGAEKDLTFAARRARICLDCGHLILFIGAQQREQLRTALAG